LREPAIEDDRRRRADPQMTKRKPPARAKLNPDDNQWFESRMIAELERLPTRAWENMGMWRRILWAPWPSTRRRLLAHMIELADKRGDPLSAKFVKRFAPHLIQALGVPQARGRIHDKEALKRAAEYRAANPKASWNDLARAAGVKRSTVRQWGQSAEFKSLVMDAELRNSLGSPKWELHEELMREVEALEPKKKSRRPGKTGFRILRPVRPKKF
jgi:hypothetical protein